MFIPSAFQHAAELHQQIVLAKGGNSPFDYLQGPDFATWAGTAPAVRYIVAALSALIVILGIVLTVVRGVGFAFAGSQAKRNDRQRGVIEALAMVAIGLLFYPVIVGAVHFIQVFVKHL